MRACPQVLARAKETSITAEPDQARGKSMRLPALAVHSSRPSSGSHEKSHDRRGKRRGQVFHPLMTIATIVTATAAAGDPAPRPYVIVGDAIPLSLTGVPGDAVRGKAIVASRQTGLCLLCHSAPLPEEKFQGTIGPNLKGAGSRNTEGQLRLRIVDPRRFNPDTIMPAYYRLDGLERVAPAFRGRTVLTAEEIEDVVAFLMTLRD
jgi:sulfur-oxidizing protein SoxX